MSAVLVENQTQGPPSTGKTQGGSEGDYLLKISAGPAALAQLMIYEIMSLYAKVIKMDQAQKVLMTQAQAKESQGQAEATKRGAHELGMSMIIAGSLAIVGSALSLGLTLYGARGGAKANKELKEAESNLQYALDRATETGDATWNRVITLYKAVLEAAESRLDAMLTGADTDEVAIKKLELEMAQGRLEDAEKALSDAQEALDEAQSESPIITAPFDGFITKVNVEGGDEILRGTIAMQLADPAKFEADILISEMDILQVKLEGEAWVQVDAMQGMSLPAKVTHISPTATIQQGVVNYKVKVEVQSHEAVMQQRQEAMQNITPGEIPDRLKQAIEEGRITQEQVEEMMKQQQQGQRGQQGRMPMIIPEGFQLREGLTVTVSIIVDERNDVLLVPNRAITTQGRQIYVQVLSPDGTIEERAITTGIGDWQYTEVTEGLSEGEQVVVPQGTAATSTTEQQQGRQGGMFIPGMGRPR